MKNEEAGQPKLGMNLDYFRRSCSRSPWPPHLGPVYEKPTSQERAFLGNLPEGHSESLVPQRCFGVGIQIARLPHFRFEKRQEWTKGMPRMTIRFLPAAVLVALIAPWTVLGQSGTTQVFGFLPTITRPQTEEIAIAISTITGMPFRDDFAKGVLSVQGTPDQLKLGAWLFAGLNKSAPVAADTAVHEYRLADGTDNVVRLFFLDRGQTVQELREFVTMLRSIAGLPRAFTSNAIKAVALRGTSDQMALADWLVNELAKTKPAPRQHSASPEYLLPAAPGLALNENVTRIFYFANTPAILDFAEVAALI